MNVRADTTRRAGYVHNWDQNESQKGQIGGPNTQVEDSWRFSQS